MRCLSTYLHSTNGTKNTIPNERYIQMVEDVVANAVMLNIIHSRTSVRSLLHDNRRQ